MSQTGATHEVEDKDGVDESHIPFLASPVLPPAFTYMPGIRSPSPAASVMSYSSIDRQELLRETYGRAFNTHNEMWMLPADSEEYRRLNVQHKVLTGALGSLYAAPELVKRALRPRQNVPCGILDIGTGSAQWAIDMAKEFPHAEVLGIDLAPPIIEEAFPGNLRIEIDDANLPLGHYAKCYNVVHCRSIEGGIHDYEGLIYNLAQVLRPGGVLLLVKGRNQIFDEHFRPLETVGEGSPGFSPIQNMFNAANISLRLRGGTNDVTSFWKEWLERNENFEQLGMMSLYIPIGAWQTGLDESQRHIAELNRLNAFRILYALRPMIHDCGFPEEEVNRWLELAATDLRHGTARIFARWEWAWAVRTNRRWQPQPEKQSIGVEQGS